MKLFVEGGISPLFGNGQQTSHISKGIEPLSSTDPTLRQRDYDHTFRVFRPISHPRVCTESNFILKNIFSKAVRVF